MHIEIADTELKIIDITTKSGKPRQLKKQSAYMHNGSKYPQRVELLVDDQAYPVGNYDIDLDKSYYVDRFGGIGLAVKLKAKK